jgi:hypothetical protein
VPHTFLIAAVPAAHAYFNMNAKNNFWKAASSILLVLSISLAAYSFATNDSNLVSAQPRPIQYQCTTTNGNLWMPENYDGVWHGQTNPSSPGFVSCHGECRNSAGVKICGGCYNIFGLDYTMYQAAQQVGPVCTGGRNCECTSCMQVGPN